MARAVACALLLALLCVTIQGTQDSRMKFTYQYCDATHGVDLQSLVGDALHTLSYPSLELVGDHCVEFRLSEDEASLLQQNGWILDKLPDERIEYLARLRRSQEKYAQLMTLDNPPDMDSDAFWAVDHDYEATKEILEYYAAAYPSICSLSVIGQTVQGRDMMVLKISDNVETHEAGEPQFKYVGNIHGDEVVSRELLLRFAHYLLSGYENGVEEIRQLISSTEIFILPTINPDGYHAVQRENANHVDLNRNFPDPIYGIYQMPEPETRAIMAWSLRNHFIISASLHGGDIVVNYPYDGNRQRLSGLYSPCPDDELFIEISNAYASHNPDMLENDEFTNGITNGAAWYILYGGMQDWHYVNTYSDFAVTIELGFTKWPEASTFPSYWESNRESLMSFLKMVHQGARGTVTNSAGEVVEATISVVGIDHPVVNWKEDGWYYRPLAVGEYTLRCVSPQFPNQILESPLLIVEENVPVVYNFVFESHA